MLQLKVMPTLFFYVGLFERGELSRLKMFGLTPFLMIWFGLVWSQQIWYTLTSMLSLTLSLISHF